MVVPFFYSIFATMITKDEYKKASLVIVEYENQEKEMREKLNTNSECELNRLPKNCSIVQNTSLTCRGCGHNINERVFYKPNK